MTPSHAMGTFLRVWRAEWAGLSRAQLAVAVGAQMRQGRPLRPGVVRWWEEGQPPGSSEELEALLQVMRRHDLARHEAEQFRQTVFAACVDRRYPELVGADEFAQRADVDEQAEAAFLPACTGAPSAVDIVALVTRVEALWQAVTGQRTAVTCAQVRKQEVAFAYLQAMLAWYHGCVWHPHLARQAHITNRAFVQERFDGWLSGHVNNDLNEAMLALFAATQDGLGRGRDQLFLLSAKAEAEGKTRHAAGVLGWAVQAVQIVGPSELRQELLAKAEAHMAILCALGEPREVSHLHWQYFHLALAEGNLREAERHLGGLEQYTDGSDGSRKCWEESAGRFALARGSHDEARQHLVKALALARRLGNQGCERGITALIAECEQA